ncbi:MarR family winged helix-turn-helix transcriptional regulator [Taklimakanibacter lacteus]|uniref:MarR family winged helix-turn-helix transcriptional regulator n=1 Tax=Taklimakanibacter lacteus TaxID=2268456 RepID=UPI000E6748A8
MARINPTRKTLVADARQAVATCVGLNVRQAARQITRVFDERLAESGLTLAQFGLLAHIAAAEDDTIGALAQRTGLEQSTLSRNLRLLESAGLVEIAIVERDLRRRLVWLTENGAHRLDKALPAWRATNKALAKVVGLEEAKALAARSALLLPGRA